MCIAEENSLLQATRAEYAVGISQKERNTVQTDLNGMTLESSIFQARNEEEGNGLVLL